MENWPVFFVAVLYVVVWAVEELKANRFFNLVIEWQLRKQLKTFIFSLSS